MFSAGVVPVSAKAAAAGGVQVHGGACGSGQAFGYVDAGVSVSARGDGVQVRLSRARVPVSARVC